MGNIYSPPQYIDRENCENGLIIEAEWRQVHNDNLRGLSQQGSNRSTVEAREMREEISCCHFDTLDSFLKTQVAHRKSTTNLVSILTVTPHSIDMGLVH
jgi:hypothetical protein